VGGYFILTYPVEHYGIIYSIYVDEIVLVVVSECISYSALIYFYY